LRYLKKPFYYPRGKISLVERAKEFLLFYQRGLKREFKKEGKYYFCLLK
jgi:hypothetical protein